jgi:4,5:9,10-diseco-3-hydroxy-5,9,17-trioxoandrosta-1(10),2-diene-4-oate hydrolase
MENTIGVDGIEICYEIMGKGDNLLLVHGNGIGRPVWDNLVPDLSKYYTVYALDLPGFGCSDMPDIPYNVPFYAEYLNKLMHQMKLEKSAVAGISMGGAVAATLAASHPDKVSKLILIAPAGLTPPQGEFVKPSRFMDASFWLLSHNKDMFRRSLEDLFYDKSKIPPKLADEIWERMKIPEHRRALLRNAQYLAKADMAFSGQLASIVAPTLIVWGREDCIIPVSDAERFAGMIPHADVLTLGRCGHAVTLEKPGPLADTFLTFLGEEDLYYTND